MTRRRFPFGLQPEASDPALDERGPDTVNRLLLHGARYHDRPAVFVSNESGELPDWRADRLSIRVALALAEDYGLGPGDVVAIALPLSIPFVLVERAVWSLGAATAFASVRRPVSAIFVAKSEGLVNRGAPVIALDSGWKALLERGGALDTPERASSLRAASRSVLPEAVASIEPQAVMTQGQWTAAISAILSRRPPERGARTALSSEEPSVDARAALYAAWADGLTSVVLGPEGGGSGSRRFANLADSSGGVHG